MEWNTTQDVDPADDIYCFGGGFPGPDAPPLALITFDYSVALTDDDVGGWMGKADRAFPPHDTSERIWYTADGEVLQ